MALACRSEHRHPHPNQTNFLKSDSNRMPNACEVLYILGTRTIVLRPVVYCTCRWYHTSMNTTADVSHTGMFILVYLYIHTGMHTMSWSTMCILLMIRDKHVMKRLVYSSLEYIAYIQVCHMNPYLYYKYKFKYSVPVQCTGGRSGKRDI